MEVEDVIVTIFRHVYPRKFFKDCRKRGWTIEKTHPGVYRVEGFSFIPTQVVVPRLVDDSMLRTLVPGAKKEDIKKVLEVIAEKKDNYFQQLGKDVMILLWETNGETLEEIKKEAGSMKGSVLDLFKDEIEEKEKRSRIRGAVETMRDDGKSDE